TDLDGDGDTDVLSASWNDDKIAWYDSDGGSPPSFTERVISTAADGARSVFATDLDGDGDTDVLSASYEGDKIAWYESNGGSPPSFTERVISTAADGANSVFATDLDGDGNTDVLSASAVDDKIAWYESDGGLPPSFTERVISTAADGAASVFATDVDGDGDTDVLSASTVDNKIAWYEQLPPIPTVSEWGLVTMTLLVLAAGTMVIRRRRATAA
ncbi:MAG: IPTL-CTERM sorting domain-containing protein, partial [Phycisphaerales bacterium]